MRRIGGKIRSWQRSLNRKYLHPGYEPHLPKQINIETASVCNLRCSCCPHGAAPGSMRPSGIMSADTFHRVVENIDIPMKIAYLHMHGEPFLNPNLPAFADELARRDITVSLSSNCTIVDEAKLNAILDVRHVLMSFSADLLSREYYESVRVGARYDDTLDNLDKINEIFARHNMFFNITIVMDSVFAGRTDDILGSCEMLYGRYSQLNGIILGSKFPWPRLPLTGDLAGHLGIGHHRCSHAMEGLNVLWNGDVTLCSFDYTGECVVGSLLDNKYSEVLNNKEARRFRMLHWRHRDNELPLCKDCLLDRYGPMSVTLHRSVFLKKDYNEKRRVIESFYQF